MPEPDAPSVAPLPGHISELVKYKFGIGFSLWLTCNAQCAHCCTNSSPRAKEALDFDVALRCLDQAGALGVRGFQVTGGEPTVFLNKLLDFFRRGQSLGMDGAITSNAFFADSPRRAKKVLQALKDAGLINFRISTDTYHDPYIPFERVLRALDTALELGIESAVEVTMVRRDPGQAKVFEELNRYTSRGVRLYMSGTLPSGTANNLPEEVFLTRSVSEMRNVGCSQAKSLFIDVDGRAYYCCNFPRAKPGAPPLDTSLYCVGNVHQDSLLDIYTNIATSKMSAILTESGPEGLLKELRQVYGEREIDQLHRPKLRYCGICDFCYSVASNPNLIPLLARTVGTTGHPDFGPTPDLAIAAKEAMLAQNPPRRELLRVVG
jgi:MoaA/NifB/PqqE/SkfB family radical SAM enzyme